MTTPGAMTSQIDRLETVVTAHMSADRGTHSEQELMRAIEQYRQIAAPDISNSERDQLARRLIDRLRIDVERGAALKAEDFTPWLDQQKQSIDWWRWKTYKHYLLAQSKMAPRVVNRMDELTDEILDLAGDPNVHGTWGRRGLVLGDVQSGKTATYLALFNKATDAGYRLIIVLAGHTESLRQQTQKRLDEGVIGRDSASRLRRQGTAVVDRFVGVGNIDRRVGSATGMTTAARDFTISSYEATSITVTSDATGPYVFVVKKNKSVLGALSSWLAEQPKSAGKLDIPLLLLDDESDYASVNTRKEDNPTAINAAIRELLSHFSRSSYVAFTATPFANIFIDHENADDLFPSDFIYSLESPSNYVGAERTFGTVGAENRNAVKYLTDAEKIFPLKHKSSLIVNNLPDSLVDAIRTFFLTNAIRDARGHEAAPRAMLINISRFKNVQRQVFSLVEDQVIDLKNTIELHAVMHAQGRRNSELASIERVFTEQFADVDVSWSAVLTALPGAISNIRVQLFNSDKDAQLAEQQEVWDRPVRMIAVGGDVLSRGLTLDGLMTSYFYRRAQASDTMLQMARWFGYRDGYEDLCRLWIDESVAKDFRFVADTVDELRADLRAMLRHQLTPRDFGLAVRKHPDTLLVTARNKMKAAETRTKTISLIGRNIETTKLSSSIETIRSNFAALESLIQDIQPDENVEPEISRRGYPIWRGVPKGAIADFLAQFHAHPSQAVLAQVSGQSPISKFVRGTTSNKFRSWDVVLVNGARTEEPVTIAGIKLFPPRRRVTCRDGQLRVSGRSSRLAGSGDLRDLIDDNTIRTLESKPDKLFEKEYYAFLSRPALLVYALRPDVEGAQSEIYESDLLVAVKLAFPGDSSDVNNDTGDVEYVINSVAIKTWFPDFDDAADDDDIDA